MTGPIGTHTALPSALPAILLAVQAFDAARVLAVLDTEAERQGLDAVVDDVVFPALRVVGTYWAHGSFDVAHEHLLTSAVTRWLHGRLPARPAQPAVPGRPIVLAAGPDDLHVLGLDCLELLLIQRRVAVCNLGAQVPADALIRTAQTVQAAAVVICSHARSAASSATASVHATRRAGLATYYAGSAFESAFLRRRLPALPLSDSVAASADLLARLVNGPRSDQTHGQLSPAS